jgi:hypothetical protein
VSEFDVHDTSILTEEAAKFPWGRNPTMGGLQYIEEEGQLASLAMYLLSVIHHFVILAVG